MTWLWLLTAWALGFGCCWAIVFVGARADRLRFEEGEKRIAAEEAKHAEHMRQLREHEDEMIWVYEP